MEFLTILCAIFLVCGTVAACLQIWDRWIDRRTTVKRMCDNCAHLLKRDDAYRLYDRVLCGACVEKLREKIASREKAND